MSRRKANRQDLDLLKGIVALLLALAAIAESASAMPAPVRSLLLLFLRRGELAAHTYVCWAARDCGASLQWALPDAVRTKSDREAALTLGWWLRILAVALRDLPRQAFVIRMARLQWRAELASAARSVAMAAGRPIALDTS